MVFGELFEGLIADIGHFGNNAVERRMRTRYPFIIVGKGIRGARKSAQLEGTTKLIAETFTGNNVHRLAH
jgi:hypothetical protein